MLTIRRKTLEKAFNTLCYLLAGILIMLVGVHKYKEICVDDIAPTTVAAEFVRVVDGDTIVVILDGEEQTVRLIGINAPESVHPDESRNTPEGHVASDYVSELMDGIDVVYLEFDQEMYDSYDRLLAYVYYYDEDELIMLNKKILDEGYAEPLIIAPNTRYAKLFN